MNRLVYSQSPQAIPAGYDAVREAEEILRQQQRTLPPTNPAAPSLWQQIRGLTVRSSLSSPLGALGTVSLGVGAFGLGWKIGEGINAKFLKFNVPPKPTGINSAELVPFDRGWAIMSGCVGTCSSGVFFSFDAQEDIFALKLNGVMASTEYDPDVFDPNYDRPGCAWSDVAKWGVPWPTGWQAYRQPATGNHNFCTGGIFTHLELATAGFKQLRYRPAGEVQQGAIEEYTDQPYTRSSPAPTPPPQTTVEQTVESELDKPENELLRHWLNYQLGSPSETDPTGIGAQLPEIEFPNWFRHWEDHNHRFADPYDDPVEYWRDAVEIVKRGRSGDPDIQECPPQPDGKEVYWDTDKEAIVVVKDGKIVTFLPPDDGYDYFLAQC